MYYKLIRTTYWTRKISDKRPDETDDYRILDRSDEQNSQTILNEVDLKNLNNSNNENTEKRRTRYLNTILSLVCGFEELLDDNDEKKLEYQKQSETKRRVENFYSLNQTKSSKIILNINLIIILSIAIGLYIFFSIPPELHIFKDLNLNQNFNYTIKK